MNTANMSKLGINIALGNWQMCIRDRYNANRALENLGFESYYEVSDINPIVLNGLSTETKSHDFFSTKGNGYQKGIYEELEDEDFII